ncbi:MAG TPA: hypothetical protein VNJ70_00865 [Thermoanaerobaculia bacterium]|nr:hypothetical protein [Thermoanaerobaculia bacterium]
MLRYFGDALGWVPTENLARGGETGTGLNFWGPTVISQRGLYSFPADEPQAGSHEVLELDRDELVGKLRQLADWADVVVRSPRHYMLHEGI